MKKKIIGLAALVGALALTGLAQAQTDHPTPPGRPDHEIVHPPLPDALKELIQQFKDQRQDILEARRALIERLKTATEEERKAIIEEFRKEQKDRILAERELRKALRRHLEELRRLRRNAGGG